MVLLKLIGLLMKNNHNTHLKEGDKAPAIHAKDQNGNPVSLKDFKGKKVILFFYPKDDTPGCTAESCNLKENYQKLKQLGFEIIGVSADTEKSHLKFIKKYDLPFRLIADTEKKVIEAYDVWGKKTFMGRTFDGIVRTTFVISEKGKIEKILNKVDTKNHTDQILSELDL